MAEQRSPKPSMVFPVAMSQQFLPALFLPLLFCMPARTDFHICCSTVPPLHYLHNGTPSRDLQTGTGSPSALSINLTIFLQQSRTEMDSHTVHTSIDDLFNGCHTSFLDSKNNNALLRSSALSVNCLPDKLFSVYHRQITFLAALPAPPRPSSPPASSWSGS